MNADELHVGYAFQWCSNGETKRTQILGIKHRRFLFFKLARYFEVLTYVEPTGYPTHGSLYTFPLSEVSEGEMAYMLSYGVFVKKLDRLMGAQA